MAMYVIVVDAVFRMVELDGKHKTKKYIYWNTITTLCSEQPLPTLHLARRMMAWLGFLPTLLSNMILVGMMTSRIPWITS